MSPDLRDQLQAALGSAYTLRQELGGGGMSRVFVATDTMLGRSVVVKVLPWERLSHAASSRFRREIQLAASLQHPHIVPLLSAGETEGLPFYLMPFVSGESLRERIARQGNLPVKETLRVLHDVATALAYAHAQGVIHRDIKPENIILSGGVAVVTDFGVAKAVNVATFEAGETAKTITSMGVAIGTAAYMSPEQVGADPTVDHRADVYAFGCIAYEMLCGKSPFAGRSAQEIMTAHLVERPASLAERAEVPAALDALVMKCLEKRASDRPASADELLESLDVLSTSSVHSEHPAVRIPAVLSRRSRAVVISGITTLIAGSGLIVWYLAQEPKQFTVGANRLVAAEPELEVDPAISPDGRTVAYAAGPLGRMRIFVRPLAGARAVPVSATLDGDHRWPRWSPDGSQLVFVAKGAAYIVPYLGGTPRLTIEAGGEPVQTPEWAPHGKELVYSHHGQHLDSRGGWGHPSKGRNRIDTALADVLRRWQNDSVRGWELSVRCELRRGSQRDLGGASLGRITNAHH